MESRLAEFEMTTKDAADRYSTSVEAISQKVYRGGYYIRKSGGMNFILDVNQVEQHIVNIEAQLVSQASTIEVLTSKLMYQDIALESMRELNRVLHQAIDDMKGHTVGSERM